MSYLTCKAGETLPLLDALWCQIYQELTKNEPYGVYGHYTFWDWLALWGPHELQDENPSYYTVEPFNDCSEGAIFDSWYKDNYTDAFMCQNSLTRLTGQCHEARFTGKNWFGYRYYQIVRSGEPTPLSYCKFMLKRAEVDAELMRTAR